MEEDRRSGHKNKTRKKQKKGDVTEGEEEEQEKEEQDQEKETCCQLYIPIASREVASPNPIAWLCYCAFVWFGIHHNPEVS